MTRLTEKEVLEIFKSNLTRKELTENYSVSMSLISSIKSGRTHSKITGKKYKKKSVKERFMEKVHKTEDCWIWKAFIYSKSGYGRFFYNGEGQKAHRSSYTLFKGRIPEGMHVLHRCDNPACVNPDHLFLGTHQDNMNDKVKKGRHRGYTKLSKFDVLEIYCYEHLSQKELAERYNVSKVTIRHIKSGTRWTSLTNK